tara:strand:+ start:790 stop:936 length:147 start_codon:yes stop_codon:yes gene_type:complete
MVNRFIEKANEAGLKGCFLNVAVKDRGRIKRDTAVVYWLSNLPAREEI